MHNKGNHVFSLARLDALHGRAGRGARRDAAARDRRAEAARERTARCAACAPATRAADARARSSPAFEPGAELTARATVLADGVQGMLSGAAIEHFGLAAREPADLRARRQGGLARPARRSTASCTRSAGRSRRGRSYREFGGTFAYPMGADTICLGLVVGLDYADASLSVHDLLQEVKTHPLFRAHARGRRAHRLGREGDSRGRLLVAARERLAARRGDPAATPRASSTCRG